MANGISIAAPGEKGSLLIVQGKADFRMTVRDTTVFLMNDRAKADSRTVARERADFRKIARGKEVLVPSGLLTENRAREPADSDMATDLFCATGKVPGHKS